MLPLMIDTELSSFIAANTVTPWFNPNLLGAWIGGGVGVFGGIYGSMVGVLAPRGSAKALVYTVHWTAMLLGAALLCTGVIALAVGQPYGVWYGLGLPGLILTGILLGLTPVLNARYREAEHRKLEAEGFRRS